MIDSRMQEAIIRTLIAIVILFIVARVLGKKQIAQLSYFDYILGITMGSIAAMLSLDSSIKLVNGIMSLVIWGVASLLFSFTALKSMTARRVLEGVPTVMIKNGQIIDESLKKDKYHLNDLMEDLRGKGVFDIADVEFAILETDGKLSVLRKSQSEPVTPKDLNLSTSYKGLCANIIIDGKVMCNHLQMLGLDEKWLQEELSKMGINSYKKVFLATLDTNGKLYVDLKEAVEEKHNVLE